MVGEFPLQEEEIEKFEKLSHKEKKEILEKFIKEKNFRKAIAFLFLFFPEEKELWEKLGKEIEKWIGGEENG